MAGKGRDNQSRRAGGVRVWLGRIAAVFWPKSSGWNRGADLFWQEHSYRIARLFGISGGTLIVALAVLSFAFLAGYEGLLFALKEADLVQGIYYFLLFIGVCIGAAIATWRGRQFEKQLRRDLFTKALEMVTEQANDARNVVGLGLLSDISSDLSGVEGARVRNVSRTLLNIKGQTQVVYRKIYDKLRHTGGVTHGVADEIKDFIDMFPIHTVLQLVFDTLKKEIDLEGLPQEVIIYSSKQGIQGGAATPMGGKWAMYPFLDMHGVACVLFGSTRDGFTIPTENQMVDQRQCFYISNSITDSIMRCVDFSSSVIITATFQNTNLEHANFNRSNLHFTNFGVGVSLGNASFSEANISGCNFQKVVNIQPSQFMDAYWVAPESVWSAVNPNLLATIPKFPTEWSQSNFWQRQAIWGKAGQPVTTLQNFLEEIRRNSQGEEEGERVSSSDKDKDERWSDLDAILDYLRENYRFKIAKKVEGYDPPNESGQGDGGGAPPNDGGQRGDSGKAPGSS